MARLRIIVIPPVLPAASDAVTRRSATPYRSERGIDLGLTATRVVRVNSADAAPDHGLSLVRSAGISGDREKTSNWETPMIYEVRNYHFQPELLEAYKGWARNSAIPYLSRRMDVVGFWVNTTDKPEINGEPMDKLGPANVTWVIRWRDLDHRNTDWPAALTGAEWEDVLSRVPGGLGSYLRTEAKFAEALI
jgi:hypothetical protein